MKNTNRKKSQTFMRVLIEYDGVQLVLILVSKQMLDPKSTINCYPGGDCFSSSVAEEMVLTFKIHGHEIFHVPRTRRSPAMTDHVSSLHGGTHIRKIGNTFFEKIFGLL
jgi:hypothetical protein